jgi:hypothetical protein
MAEPLKKDEALAAAVREAFQRHMENARLAAEALKEKQAAATAQRAASSPARDPRLIVPKPANEAGAAATKAVAETNEAKPARDEPTQGKSSESRPAEVKPSSPSLDHLVALASPPKEPASRPAEAPLPEAEAEAKPVPTPEAPSSLAAVQADPAPAVEDSADDNGFDFGEALFIEIAPEAERKPQVEPPKMPRAASLDTPAPAPEQPGSEAEQAFEFRGPPSRERPRMSTVSPTAEPPQDLDLKNGGSSPAAYADAAATPVAPSVKEEKPVMPQLAPARKPTRFGVNPAVNANDTRVSRRNWAKIKLPPALIASALLAAGIAAVGAYFWANPDKLQSLGSMVAPPASTPPETKVAAAPAPASSPAPAPSVTSPASAPAPAPSSATRSVSTIAITVDEVDQAVQSARELLASGDVIGAREALESYRSGSDPRALFALAETYDPAIVKDASQANAAQAKAFYEAAAKAGSQDTAERLARLALVHAN